MGALLTGSWPEGSSGIVVTDAAGVSLVREAVRAEAAAIGLARERAESLVTAASEIAHNQVAHGRRGEMLVRRILRRGTPGVEVLARDEGAGIRDPSAALRGETAGSGGLGVGLSAAYRLADELDFDVRWGEGTAICARKFKSALPRSEVAILARPCDGEALLGDDALFAWDDGGLLCAVADGLGHGPLARLPAQKAMAVVHEARSRSPAALLESCWAPLAPTRGAVMSVIRIDEAGGQLLHAGVGNVSSQLYRGRTSVHLPSTPGVVGHPGPRPRLQEDVAPLGGRHVLVMFSDGVSSRLDLSKNPELLREPPLVIAHRVLTEHGRGHDDALVLVATG
jgi:anti-sigma regulatory factor (Ser/Thr protein kinase)